ncbi:zinc-dependent alcohol dehydrogenase family protein [Roseateles oligotrophus]|uniref:Zinc-dependent alcohol dehydrogenase family protein n=1 Tax=Roseateles oligotrophus TaxID=1769250 RepID=A0ABT2YMN5_9BURK|nr:zinc-dependent alcohol dehydrogenase family protein [Roseateles oligotrophus]MCV2371332.1 zinc-dependent alcohol dehydrogenase family protein [Roseateles oligotrophus]
MALQAPGRGLVEVWQQGLPQPAAGQLRIKVAACGVCRTDLHIIDGELPFPAERADPGVVPGHEVVGRVDALGAGVLGFALGARVGVPWLGWTCGACPHCLQGRENLCESARFTGWQLAGGYAQYMLADARYVFELPPGYDDEHAAPLLCAGLIGYRAYRMSGLAQAKSGRLGLYGFGAAAHLLAQLAMAQGLEVYAFTRPGDERAQALARRLGLQWVGDSAQPPPQPLDAALLFAPQGSLVPQALRAVRAGGAVVCAGIHMSDIPTFPYAWLWGERRLQSVANLSRADGEEFLRLAARLPLQVHTQAYALCKAEQALHELRQGQVEGAAVLLMT